MLLLTRKTGQSIVIGDQIIIKVISIDGNTVRLGIEAPHELPVYRREIYLAICEENLRALGSAANLGCLQAPGPEPGVETESGPGATPLLF